MLKLHKVLSLLMTACLLLLTVGCAGGSQTNPGTGGNENETITLKLASMYADPASSSQYNSAGSAQARFAELVSEKSNGRLKIENFFNSVLGGEPEMLSQVQNGDLDMFFGNVYSTSGIKFAATTIPCLFDNIDQAIAATYGSDAPVCKLMTPCFDEIDVKLLAMGVGSIRGFISKEQVVLPSDVQGMKVRTFEDTATNIFWGGIGTAAPMPVSEVYSALQTNTIEGLEFGISSCLTRKYDEVANYYTDIDWRWACTCNFLINPSVFESLPEDLRTVLIDCAWEAADFQNKTEAGDMDSAYKEMEARSVTVIRLTDEQRQAWIDYGRSLDDKLKAEMGEAVFEEMMAAANSVK